METFFKHSIITSGNQEDVENEINVYTNDKYINNIISINVTPERVGNIECEGHLFPKYIYHICIVYN